MKRYLGKLNQEEQHSIIRIIRSYILEKHGIGFSLDRQSVLETNNCAVRAVARPKRSRSIKVRLRGYPSELKRAADEALVSDPWQASYTFFYVRSFSDLRSLFILIDAAITIARKGDARRRYGAPAA